MEKYSFLNRIMRHCKQLHDGALTTSPVDHIFLEKSLGKEIIGEENEELRDVNIFVML
jgi:hypothetical protein